MPPETPGQENTPTIDVAQDGGRLLLNQIFGSLADSRRRYVLYYLRDCERASIDDLATQIVAWERGIPRADVSDQVHRRVKTDLVHNHLEKLEENKLIEYDPAGELVFYRQPPIPLEEIMEITAAFEQSA